MGREPASAYFHANRTNFEHIVEQVELCQPPSGRLVGNTDIECASPGGSSQALFEAVRRADARWIRVFYNERDGERHLTRTMIAIHAYGMSYAGEIEAFVYHNEPADQAEYERIDDGIAIEEKEPLTEAPHHWYWWRIAR